MRGDSARLRDPEHAAGVAHVDPLPGQRLDHRKEPFGGRSPSRKTSLTFARDGQLGFELLDPALRGGEVERSSVLNPATSPRSTLSCLSQL